MLLTISGQARTGRLAGIAVIEPYASHPALDQARAARARIMIANPAAPRVLLPVLAGRRGMRSATCRR